MFPRQTNKIRDLAIGITRPPFINHYGRAYSSADPGPAGNITVSKLKRVPFEPGSIAPYSYPRRKIL